MGVYYGTNGLWVPISGSISGGSNGGGSSGGYMEKSVYDSDGAVAAAGGIKAYVQKNGGGGDGFIQADWNQNDESAASYIKNRPFYEHTMSVELLKLENATFTIPDENIPLSIYQSEAGFEIEANKTYIVNWDETEYICTSIFVEGANAFGNLSAMGFGAGNGEPFIFGYVSAQNMFFIYDLNKETSHTISVSEVKTDIKYIDPKYIKDMYYDNITETVIIEEQTVTGFALTQDPIYEIENPFTINIIDGNTYIVNWDGTEYELVAATESDITYIGNVNYVNMTSGGDVPFAVLNENGTIYLVTESTAESHTISITEITHDIKQIDEKYLPNISIPEDSISNIVKYTPQELTDEQKAQARTNIGAISQEDVTGVVRYIEQTLTDEQKAQARTNIGVEDAINEALSAFLFAEGQTF